ncbi:inner-membrane translocator [Clostridium sartagoforme AAU1]|uniref:Inner-membrane translocator n=1 Tax=Clostridium sartagoforme AAU1 TaxID=1202534 RepID=R9CFU8_9CLOT|nr:branched-chain amino acid ABC transporter permease [Clostridium sartagoforme]EOR27865.1 inner-membrane translocator [Clostridium sartagoforme AAU1]
MKKLFENRYSKYILLGIILASLPLLQDMGIIKSSTITTFGTILFYAIVAVGLNVLLGYSGLISLGTAGFMGFGAYLSAYLTQDLKLPFLVSLIISIIVPLIIGLLIGLVSLRISGMYLAIATLAVSEIFKKIFIEFDNITGGFSGKTASYPEIFGFGLNRDTTFILIVVILIIVMILTDNFIHSSTGRALLTMRVSEPAAQAMGINLLKYKLTAFAIATVYASLGGVLYVHFIRFSYPATWNLLLSLQILAVIVIGGLRTITGPIIGSIIVFGVPELILKQLPVIGSIDGLAYIFTGILIIIVILFYPHGLIYIGKDIKKYINKKKVKVNELNANT